MEKLLAALSLPQVGDIRLIPAAEDPEKKDGLFALELNTRVYTLRAKSEAEAILWVNTLTQIRQQGLNAAATAQSKSKTSLSTEAKGGGGAEGENKGQWVKENRKCFGCC
jgi:hypothetical protein